MRIELTGDEIPDELVDEDGERWVLDPQTGRYAYQGKAAHALMLTYLGVDQFHGVVEERFYAIGDEDA